MKVRFDILGYTLIVTDEMGFALAGVYGALAYYPLNREVIEVNIQANSEAAVMKSLNRIRRLLG